MGKRAVRIPVLLVSMTLVLSGAFTLLRVRRQVREAQTMLGRLEAEAAALRLENERLREENAAADERERTEHIARSRLGLVYPNEKVIIILGD